MTKIKFPSLNGLRACSICLVILHHLALKNGLLSGLRGVVWLQPIFNLIFDGDLGVNVFFVISGFLITSLMIAEQDATGTVSLKKFYIRRTLRIFPAYYFLLLVYLVMQALHVIYIMPISWLTAVTYTKYFTWYFDWFTAHAWSLSIEEQFYLCWPLIFLTGRKTRTVIALAMVLAVPFVRLYLGYHPSPWFNDLNFFTRMDAIAIGCLFALHRDRILGILKPWFRLLFYVSFVLIICFPYVMNWAGQKHMALAFSAIGFEHGTLANVFLAIIIMYSVFGPQGPWYRLLNLKAVNYIGLLSYSIYLWQQLFISGADWKVSQMPLNLLCLFGMALFSYYCIERPFNRLKKRFEVK